MTPLPSRIINGKIEKQCSKCLIFKVLEDFNKENPHRQALFNRVARCKHCQSLAKAKWSEKFKERERAKRMSPNEKNKRNARERNRYASNPNFKIEKRLRARMYSTIKKGKKCYATLSLLGADYDTIKNHIESQFQPGMTWNNSDKWHIDHIKPCSSFNLTKESEQRLCFNYKNLQPLWAGDNLKKGNKIIQQG